MTPTRPSTLVLSGVLAALCGFVLIGRVYGSIAALPWPPLATLLLLAVAEFVTALATRARIARRPGTRPVDPLVVVRLAALAKASSLVGALAAGVFLGTTGWLLMRRAELAAAGTDLPVSIGGVVAGLLLLIAGLLLERACRIPPHEEDPDDEFDLDPLER
jgi:hypothetical protein